MSLNKSLITNAIATLLVVVGLASPIYADVILQTGLFALAGGATNWLAIHMLFEKVPFLYGSGVIPHRFEEFKTAIKELIMHQFFTEENLQRFFHGGDKADGSNPVQGIVDALDYEQMYQALIDAIMQSSFASMLAMLGGASALEPLREPIINKLQEVVAQIANSDQVSDTLGKSVLGEKGIAVIKTKIESVIDQRLDELTPQMVKEIVQRMIQQHLGWLVVWGGVFGGLIGLVVGVLRV